MNSKSTEGKKPKYDIVTRSDLLWNMGMNIKFIDEQLNWDRDKIPLKMDGAI